MVTTGINMLIPGADASANPAGFVLPPGLTASYSNLLGLFSLGASASLSGAAQFKKISRNLAPNYFGAQGTVYGAPTVNTGYSTFGSIGWIDTGIPDISASGTIIAIGMTTDTLASGANRPSLVNCMATNTSANTLAGSAIVYAGSSNTAAQPHSFATFNASGTYSSTGPLLSPQNVTTWHCYVGTWLQGTGMTIQDMTLGNSNTLTNTNPVVLSPATLLIGMTPQGVGAFYSGTANIAGVEIWNVPLSASDISQRYAWWKTFVALDGITI